MNHSPAARKLSKFLTVVSALLSFYAGPYRVLAWKFRTFGSKATGTLTWIGIVLWVPLGVMPVCDWYGGEIGGEFAVPFIIAIWLAMFLVGWVQMFVKWCSLQPPRDPCRSHAWLGRWEPALIALAMPGALSFNPGAAMFILFCYACSMAQVGLARLCKRLDAWTPEDQAWLAGKLSAASAGVAGTVTSGAEGAKVAGVFVTHAAGKGAAMAKEAMDKRAERKAAQPIYIAPRTSFMARVRSTIVAHIILSTISGWAGFNVILALFSFAFAVPLWIIGAKVDLPDHAMAWPRSVIGRVKETFRDKKEAVAERIENGKERLAERWRNRHGNDETDDDGEEVDRGGMMDGMRSNMEDAKEKMSAGIQRRKRQLIWNAVTR